MDRRTFLAVPALVALATWPARAGWRGDMGEVRFGAVAAARRSPGLARHLGLAVWPVELPAAAMARAFDAGQVECGVLPARDCDRIQVLMGDRVMRAPGGVLVLRSLPAGLRAALLGALTAGA